MHFIIKIVLPIGQDHQIRIVHLVIPTGFLLGIKSPFNLLFGMFCRIRGLLFVIAHSPFPGRSHTTPVRVQHTGQPGTESQVAALPLEVIPFRINERPCRNRVADDLYAATVGKLLLHLGSRRMSRFFTNWLSMGGNAIAGGVSLIGSLVLSPCRCSAGRGFTFPDKVKATQNGHATHTFRISNQEQSMFSHGQVLEQHIHPHLSLETDQGTVVQLFQPPDIPLGVAVHLCLHTRPFKYC